MNEALTGYQDHSDDSNDPVNHLERKELKILLIQKKSDIETRISLIEQSVGLFSMDRQVRKRQHTGCASVMIDLNQRNLKRLHDQLTDIEHALNKFSNGTFGYCEGSGHPMPVIALRKTPWLRFGKEYIETLEKIPRHKKCKIFLEDGETGSVNF